MKSSLCAALAVQAVATGAKVELLDWEPQGSLTYWWTVRGRLDNPSLITNTDRSTPADVALRSNADWLFCDTAPAMLEQVERAIEAADYVLIPLLASALDLVAARTIVAICGELNKSFGFVLTRVNTQRETPERTASCGRGRQGRFSAGWFSSTVSPAPLSFASNAACPGASGHGALLRSSARIGSSIRNVDPFPSVDSTQMRPPCISTICLAMARPRPVPPLALVRELST